MRANADCGTSRCLTVYLNGEKLEDCFEADEEAGYAWVEKKGSNGERLLEINALPPALVYEGLEVKKVRGDIKIKIDTYGDLTEETVREECEFSFKPVVPRRVKVANCVIVDFNPFDLVIEAYETLYGKPCLVQFVEGMYNGEGDPWGCTEFVEGKSPRVSVDVRCPFHAAVEVLAHELAHVAVGDGGCSESEEHGDDWSDAFTLIHQRYNELALEAQ